MRTKKILMAVLLLGGGLSMLSAAGVQAATFDGALFSVQDRGFGHKGGHGKSQFREAGNSRFVPPDKGGRRQGQLTEEERRQLHRDLDKANREIYGGRRGR